MSLIVVLSLITPYKYIEERRYGSIHSSTRQ